MQFALSLLILIICCCCFLCQGGRAGTIVSRNCTDLLLQLLPQPTGSVKVYLHHPAEHVDAKSAEQILTKKLLGNSGPNDPIALRKTRRPPAYQRFMMDGGMDDAHPEMSATPALPFVQWGNDFSAVPGDLFQAPPSNGENIPTPNLDSISAAFGNPSHYHLPPSFISSHISPLLQHTMGANESQGFDFGHDPRGGMANGQPFSMISKPNNNFGFNEPNNGGNPNSSNRKPPPSSSSFNGFMHPSPFGYMMPPYQQQQSDMLIQPPQPQPNNNKNINGNGNNNNKPDEPPMEHQMRRQPPNTKKGEEQFGLNNNNNNNNNNMFGGAAFPTESFFQPQDNGGQNGAGFFSPPMKTSKPNHQHQFPGGDHQLGMMPPNQWMIPPGNNQNYQPNFAPNGNFTQHQRQMNGPPSNDHIPFQGFNNNNNNKNTPDPRWTTPGVMPGRRRQVLVPLTNGQNGGLNNNQNNNPNFGNQYWKTMNQQHEKKGGGTNKEQSLLQALPKPPQQNVNNNNNNEVRDFLLPPQNSNHKQPRLPNNLGWPQAGVPFHSAKNARQEQLDILSFPSLPNAKVHQAADGGGGGGNSNNEKKPSNGKRTYQGPLPKCGSVMPIAYNPKKQFCCDEVLYDSIAGQVCCEGTYAFSPSGRTACCSNVPYNLETHKCTGNGVVVSL